MKLTLTDLSKTTDNTDYKIKDIEQFQQSCSIETIRFRQSFRIIIIYIVLYNSVEINQVNCVEFSIL